MTFPLFHKVGGEPEALAIIEAATGRKPSEHAVAKWKSWRRLPARIILPLVLEAHRQGVAVTEADYTLPPKDAPQQPLLPGAPLWTIRLTLPMPPSVNKAYANIPGRGRVASRHLKEWKIEAGWRLELQRPKRTKGAYRAIIRVGSTLRGDIDNRIKPLLDLLVEHMVTDDDQRADRVAIERSPELQPSECIVTIQAVA